MTHDTPLFDFILFFFISFKIYLFIIITIFFFWGGGGVGGGVEDC